MKLILTEDYSKQISALRAMPEVPLIGDEILVLDGNKTAAYKVFGRRWVLPTADERDTMQPYVALKVKKV